MGKIMRNDVEYGGGSGGGGDVSQLEQRVERLEDDVDSLERYKVTQLTFNTGIDIGDWDSVIDPDEPVIYEKYVNYHDAVAKLSQQIDVMGNRTDDLKTSLNDLVSKTYTHSCGITFRFDKVGRNVVVVLHGSTRNLTGGTLYQVNIDNVFMPQNYVYYASIVSETNFMMYITIEENVLRFRTPNNVTSDTYPRHQFSYIAKS